jgi:hypothetical protein
MKKILLLISVVSLFTTGCIAPEGDRHEHGRDEDHHEGRDAPPEVIVRPPEVIVR